MGVLDKILASKKEELPALRSRKLPSPPSEIPRVALKREDHEPLSLICEIKRRSPSAGELSRALSVTERAKVYEKAGASMLSVLCDGPFFDGDFEHLREAREGCRLPLLCKEFVIDECQLDAAQAYGASAVLLIVRCLDDSQLQRLISESQTRGLTPLVEVFSELEAQRGLNAGATLMGVNARDLDTLVMDSARAQRIVDSMPADITVAHLSGVKTPEDVASVAQGRADAALIGEVLMRQDAPHDLLVGLRDSARSPRLRAV